MEQLTIDEGRLDDVFRAITLPDTERGSVLIMSKVWTIARRELGGSSGIDGQSFAGTEPKEWKHGWINWPKN